MGWNTVCKIMLTLSYDGAFFSGFTLLQLLPEFAREFCKLYSVTSKATVGSLLKDPL
jgi:hypothetical protein